MEIIKTINSYVFRRYIVGIPTNSLNKTFAVLYNSINNSTEYKEYLEINNILKEDKKINNLINEIKSLQKEAVKLESEGNTKYKEIDKEIDTLVKKLNSIPKYIEYKDKLKKFNNVLKVSSTLIEDYIDDKISI